MDQAQLENTKVYMIITGLVGVILAFYLFFRETRLFEFHQSLLHLGIAAFILSFHVFLAYHAFRINTKKKK